MKISIDIEVGDLFDTDYEGDVHLPSDALKKEIAYQMVNRFTKKDDKSINQMIENMQDNVKRYSEQEVKLIVKDKMDSFIKNYFEQEIFVQGDNWRSGNKISVQQYMDEYIEKLTENKSCGSKIPSIISDYVSSEVKFEMNKIKSDTKLVLDRIVKEEIEKSEAARFLKKIKEEAK